jgi:far upstream element-binding protein
LDRRPPPNPAEKVFVIRGSPDQIEQAKRIISEKIGMVGTCFFFTQNINVIGITEFSATEFIKNLL